MLFDYFQFSHMKQAKLCEQLTGCVLWIRYRFYMNLFYKTRYCERSRVKRGEFAERRLTSRRRVSSCTGIWENKTIEYLENKAFLTYGVITKNVCFHLLNPFPTWTGPARPDPNALWKLISRKLSYLQKQIRDKKLVNDLKFIVLKFGIDILISLAVITGLVK